MIASMKRKIRRFRIAWMRNHPEDAVHALRLHYGPKTTNLDTLDEATIPAKVEGFHDMAYLFACNYANRGVIAQDFDEAAYIWKIITTRRPAHLLEIGRWLGGSTILQAAAAAISGGKLTSVDLKVKMPHYAEDKLIKAHLEKLCLDNVNMVIANSREFQPDMPVEYAFIDGDHSYEGVKSDFENVVRYLVPGGDMLFHDGCATRPFATRHDPVACLMTELLADERVEWVAEVGSLVHFRATEKRGLAT